MFSKYGYVIPLKSKRASDMVEAFKCLWDSNAKPPQFIWVDKGTEFFNESMKVLLKWKNVKMYTTENEEKSCIVEGWN